MKVKTFFLELSLLAIAGMWTGCSKDDEVVVNAFNDQQPISFRVQGGMPTLRSTGTTVPFVNAFVVFGNTNDQPIGTNIFNGTTIARQPGGGNNFDYNPKKYYSATAANAEFAAYSPVSTKISAPSFVFGIGSGSGSGFSFNYEVAVPDATGNTTQEDLLVAGTPVVVSTTPTPVQLSFQHALSRIFVKATNTLSETIIIKSLKLKNLYSTGKITGTPGASWSWNWSDFGSKKDYDYVLAPTGVAVKAKLSSPTLVTSMEQGMMVLPQDVGNSSKDPTLFALEVNFDLSNINNTEYIYIPNVYAFEMGKQYAVTINFSGFPSLIVIDFTIDVTPFFEPIVDAP